MEIRISCFRIDCHFVQVVYSHRKSKSYLPCLVPTECVYASLNMGTPKSVVLGGSELGSDSSCAMYQL